jgi:hypothetical protein
MPDGGGVLPGAFADFDHLAVVPWSWSAQQAHERGAPTRIHIGREPRIRKGFVIMPTNRKLASFRGGQAEATVTAPTEVSPLRGSGVFWSRVHVIGAARPFRGRSRRGPEKGKRRPRLPFGAVGAPPAGRPSSQMPMEPLYSSALRFRGVGEPAGKRLRGRGEGDRCYAQDASLQVLSCCAPL